MAQGALNLLVNGWPAKTVMRLKIGLKVGAFDIWGASHQWFHLSITLSMSIFACCILTLAETVSEEQVLSSICQASE